MGEGLFRPFWRSGRVGGRGLYREEFLVYTCTTRRYDIRRTSERVRERAGGERAACCLFFFSFACGSAHFSSSLNASTGTWHAMMFAELGKEPGVLKKMEV